MTEIDEAARKDFPKKPDNFEEIAQEHSKQMLEIINEVGVVDLERFGEDAARNAALVVMHSSHEVQQKYLELLDKSDKSNIYGRGYAYLKDRVLVSEKGYQLYGTQMKVLNDKGDLALNPIFDIEHIEQRRLEIGLEPFTEYVASVEKMTGKKLVALEPVGVT